MVYAMSCLYLTNRITTAHAFSPNGVMAAPPQQHTPKCTELVGDASSLHPYATNHNNSTPACKPNMLRALLFSS